MSDNLPHVVIIGGGFAGIAAARKLAKTPVRITLIDRRNHHLFGPLLHEVALAELSPSDIAYPIRSILSSQANATVLLAEATAIDAEQKKVILTDGELSYDYLIVAAGACTNFPNADWSQFSIGLKELEDATEIRKRILLAFENAERETNEELRQALLTFVVIGGGATGVEVAGSLGVLSRYVLLQDFRNINPQSARVVLVQGADRILKEMGIWHSAKATAYLRNLGVEVRTNTRVTGLTAEGVQLGNEFLPSATMISCVGVKASPVASSIVGAPQDKAGRVLVAPDLSVPGHPEIFVVGDACAFLHQGDKPLPGLAPVAKQGGVAAAVNIIASLYGHARTNFHYQHKGSLVTVGRSSAVADFGYIHLSGFAAWMAWLFIHVFFLIGFRNRLLVIFQWLWSFITSQRGARLITGHRMKAGPQQMDRRPPGQ